MQCIGSSVTKSSAWKPFRNKPSSVLQGLWRSCLPKPTNTGSYRRAYASTINAFFRKEAVRDTSLSIQSDTLPLNNSPYQFAPLTAAQVSRAAAQAVRVCSKTSLQDALYVVNSVYLSSQLHVKQGALNLLGPRSSSVSFSSPSPKPLPFNAIDFGQAVPPRLSAHCFLHALVRGGHSYKAGRYAELMMEQGLRIRASTLEKIVDSLSQDSVSSILARSPLKLLKKPASVGLSIHPEHFVHAGNRAAYRILMHARKFGQDRSRRMYDALINGCLMQGEIIVGSLLFVLMVKDWQAHAAHKKLASEKGDETEGDEVDTGNDCSSGGHLLDGYQGEDRELEELAFSPQPSRTQGSWRATASTPYPTQQLLKRIANHTEAMLNQEPREEGDETYLQEPLQALVNLALLVEEGRIHFGHLSPLIRAIYVCPKTRERVWVRKKRKLDQVDGYKYLHGFLLRIIKSFQGKDRLRIPPLDTRSYNSLLHYALRHRFSPSLASAVLDHMCTKRRLQPNIGTYNILLRSGTILRRSDISDTALQALQRDEQSFGRLVAILSSAQVEGSEQYEDAADQLPERALLTVINAQQIVARPHAPAKGKLAKKMRWLQRIQQEHFVLPELIRHPHGVPMADKVTISSYISHLVSIGHPQVVASAVFYIFPELDYENMPSADLQGEERLITLQKAGEACLGRAVRLGPVFFATLLNALTKAGKTGLAERVFSLAMEAQYASWTPDFCPDIAPWSLTIHAYTSMLQCYAKEATKGLPKHIGYNESHWDPRSNLDVCGWGRFVRGLRSSQNVKRYSAGRTLALALFRAVMSRDYSVFQRGRSGLVHATPPEQQLTAETPTDAQTEGADEVTVTRHFQPPVPDTRFFNAALRSLSSQPGMRARAVRYSRSHYKRLLRWRTELYARTGVVCTHWTPGLQEVAQAMVSAGYSVPLGLRHIFVGRWDPGTVQWDSAPTVVRSPFAYPDSLQRTFLPHSIPTTKTRGLPIGPTRKRSTR